MRPGALVVLGLVFGCNALGSGALALRVGAEGAAMEGLGPEVFADGWSVTFDRYLVSIADVELETTDGESVTAEGPFVVDLHGGEPEVDMLEGLDARRWDRVAFSVSPPGAGAPAFGDEADAAQLASGGFDYWVEGRGTHTDGRSVGFAWGLANPTRNADCVDGTDGKPGVVVRASKTTEGEITLHIEHMFWDRLGSEQTVQRFEAIAALAQDGTVSWDALAGQVLTDLRDANGEPLLDEAGAPLFYDPGSTAVTNLQAFILAATSTQAHWNGEGLCTVNVL